MWKRGMQIDEAVVIGVLFVLVSSAVLKVLGYL
mgnify:CR=1 FL=1